MFAARVSACFSGLPGRLHPVLAPGFYLAMPQKPCSTWCIAFRERWLQRSHERNGNKP
jgi:hypothetical protein